MASLSEALTEKAGPFPVWLWAAAAGGALYLLAHYRNQQASGSAQGNPTFSPFAGGAGALFGSPAALTGPVLQPNPTPVDAINPQTSAATTPNALYIPTPVPPVGGGDIPTVSGFVGISPTNYDRARNGGGS